MPTVLLNGDRRTLPEGATVQDAIEAAGVPGDGRGVAVALDGEVVPRGQWSATTLEDDREVEVLHAVQGG
jgi:sulfur carrier protein